jgi:DUF1680 family protein
MRTIASLGGYLATRSDAGIQLHQYTPATVRTGAATLAVDTRYPLDGAVEVSVLETADRPWTLALRVPGWCRGATVSVNGTPVPASAGPSGYLEIARQWRAGDRVALTLPMRARLTAAHPSADALRGAVAIERGPIVYCLESLDQPEGVDVNRVELCVDEPLHEQVLEGFLGEDPILVTATGLVRDDSGWAGAGWAALAELPPQAGRRVTLTAIPYHLWANRGPSVMRVFVPAR